MQNPIRRKIENVWDQQIRQHYLPRIQFSEPAGDPGWFGPGSPVWYVHEHIPSMLLGNVAFSVMETLHPGTMWAGVDHSMGYERINGVPTGRNIPENFAKRFGGSLSAFLGSVFGSTPVAEHSMTMVRNMHRKVHGVRRDGLPYDTRETEFFRWNYATVVWGWARAHEVYHPHPLRGADLDEYYRQYTRIGRELFGEPIDLPASKAEVADYLEETSKQLALSPPGAKLWAVYQTKGKPLKARPVVGLVRWAILDLQPDWAREILLAPPRSGKVSTAVRRSIIRGLFAVANSTTKDFPEIADAYRRARATPTASAAVPDQVETNEPAH
jgi:uncharacterized protein (DUF2236 family)